MAESLPAKRYVRAPGEPEPAPGRRDEFPASVRNRGPLDRLADWKLDRAGFLKLVGFGAASAALASPAGAATKQLIPLLAQPEELAPGTDTWYASVCPGCAAGCGILARDRAGRPVKLEGNPDHPLNAGGLCAVGQASLLELYDAHALAGPLADGKPAAWADVDRAVTKALAEVRAAGKAVRLLSRTVTSPTVRAAIGRFLGGFPNARHVEVDPLSASAILDAHRETHGVRALPRYRFDRAEVIASFDADFLGAWISPVEFTRAWRSGRRLDSARSPFSRHVQVESRLSLTGAKADERWAVAAPDVVLVLAHLARALGVAVRGTLPACPVAPQAVKALARDLAARPGRGLVVCGENDLDAQRLVNAINLTLGAYGATLDLARPSRQRAGDDRAAAELLRELEAGKVGALVVLDANPVHDWPEGERLGRLLARVPLTVSLATHRDETAAAVAYVAPDRHGLASWGDAEPVAGLVAVRQPVTAPRGDARPALETLARWAGAPATDLAQVRAYWAKTVHPASGSALGFEAFWNQALDRGFVALPGRGSAPSGRPAAVAFPAARWKGRDDLALVLYPKAGLPDGRHAGNPWLQELPDPISKVTWDNYAAVAPATAARLGLTEGDKVRLAVDGATADLPVHVQSGTHERTVAVAVGYGAEASRRFAVVGPQWLFGGPSVGRDGLVGVNAAPLLARAGGLVATVRTGLTVRRTGGRRKLACTQSYQSMDVPANLAPQDGARQPIVREMTLAAWRRDPAGGGKAGDGKPESLYPDRQYPEHRWGMAIDLTACTGCSACMVACQAENNVPVVGRDEVLREREMSWIRIDRYIAEQNGRTDVIFEPMLCQHCDDAPCEPVCPVAATLTSAEGLSQQVYNRCVGTRYCENNCPYKVRRFNYFTHSHPDPVERLVLNPDVTVRSRGVMEKCSFCVQRIQGAKAQAKREGRPLRDGDVKTACQSSCPANAIVFGDLKDLKSRAAKLSRDPRGFKVLGELNTRPAITYLAVVRNRPEGA